MMKWILMAVAGLFALPSFGQESDSTFTYDRPGIADSPFLIPIKHHQIEVGFEHYRRDGQAFSLLPVVFYRAGITKNAELRVSTRYRKEGGKLGFGLTAVGAKLHIIEEKGFRPEVALITNLILPLGQEGFVPHHFGHDLVLAFHDNFSETVGFNYNLGSIWENFEQRNVWTYSACFNFAVNEKIVLFAEHYAFIPNKDVGEFGIDGGIMYSPRPTVQFDFSAGISKEGGNCHQFATLGVAFRMK